MYAIVTDMETLGYWMADRLRDLDLTISELARRCGVSHVHISRIISGARGPSPELANCLARNLRVTPQEFFRRLGWLPRISSDEQLEEELLFYFDQFTLRQQLDFIRQARALAQAKEDREVGDELEEGAVT